MESNGGQIGAYTLLREIAQGGMGVVYLAARTADFSKQVAVKVLKRGMDTDALLARFQRERQILARLEHKNIARLLDGGATQDGRPYLVMEYVDGSPVTTHCQSRQLNTRDRLRLFLQVCEGVLCAHRSLVIHRDLKPSNILVTSNGEVKLLDFGIAKLLEAEAAETMPLTAGEHGLFTPEYASPEQVQGRAITVLTDVYSLGAVLYELLVGRTPHIFESRTALEIERVICEKEAARPSSAGLPRDLEEILMMALRKEPERRYSSVEQLAADIRRYLDGLPVFAHPDSAGYRANKFLRRHRGMVLAASVAVAGVLAGTMLAVQQTQAARRNRAVAEKRFAQVRKLAGTMLFDHYNRIRSLPGATKARESIVQTAQQYLDSLAAEAGDDRALALELVAAYQRLGEVQGMPGAANLGQTAEAIESFHKAQRLLDRFPMDDPQVLRLAISNLRVSAIHEREGRMPEARQQRHKRLRLARQLYEMDREKNDAWYGLIYALQSAAVSDVDAGLPREAIPNLEYALRLAEEWNSLHKPPRGQSVLGQIHSDMASVMRGLGDVRQAIAYGERVLEIRLRTVRQHPNHEPYWRQVFMAHWFLGADHAHPQLLSLGDVAKAKTHCEESIRWARKSVEADPANEQAKIDLAIGYRCLGAVYLMSDPARAIEEYRRSLAIAQAILIKKPGTMRYLDDTANSWWGLASAQRLLGRANDAEEPYRITLRMFDQIHNKSQNFSYRQQLMYARMEYGMLRMQLQDEAGAALHLNQAVELARHSARDFPGEQSKLDLTRALAAAKR